MMRAPGAVDQALDGRAILSALEADQARSARRRQTSGHPALRQFLVFPEPRCAAAGIRRRGCRAEVECKAAAKKPSGNPDHLVMS
jgi:hypothetical protein